MDWDTGDILKPTGQKLGQSQASLNEQLIELIAIANRAGLYDAADFLAKHLCR